MAKKKVAVLGGGVGAMSAVWALTTLPGWEQEYEITVYQMGWRLGGKGASGRNPDAHQRIEEHGLHVWAGFYDNAFRIMREVYEANDRQTGPVRTFDEAFTKHSDIIIEENIKGKWEAWKIQYPTNSDKPGEGDELPSMWAYIEMTLELMLEFLHKSTLETTDGVTMAHINEVFDRLSKGDDGAPTASHEDRSVFGALLSMSFSAVLEAASKLAKWMGKDVAKHLRVDHLMLVSLLERAFNDLEDQYRGVLDDHDDARHLYYLLDIGLAVIKGMVMDGVVFRGWDAIDIWDWPEWMRRWGASEYTLESVMVRGIFDYIFGYPKGDVHNPRVGAGTAIHGVMRLAFTYKGALFYEMQAGMGDIVFGPMYEALHKRGVKFAFFHKLENMVVGADGKTIEALEINVQATTKSGDEYEPLIDVKGVPSWPSYPRYDQLVEGAQLKADKVNLELSWDAWPGVSKLSLARGVDFDEVILGISVGAFKDVCKELMVASPRFERMVYGVKTTQTQAVQLWMDPDAAALGAPQPPPVTTGYVDPINTWSDLSYLIDREDWPAADSPRYLVYFCGPMEDAPYIPPFSDHDFPARELERVKSMAKEFFSAYAGHMWPKGATPQNPDGLDFNLLHGSGSGDDRFNQQYFRANIEPTERYVISVPGSTSLRFRAKEPDFDNLFFVGDWTYTSISAGCVECAAMSGLHCAEAVSGKTLKIVDRAY